MARWNLGSSAQYDRMIEECCRYLAEERGDLELYHRGQVCKRALEALRQLKQLDPQWTDYAMQLILHEREISASLECRGQGPPTIARAEQEHR